MSYFSRMSPLRAWRDLRSYLAQRPPYEVGFLILATAITWVVVVAFAHDSRVAPVYRPEVVYVQQWKLDRTDAEIRAAQVIDQAAKDKRLAEEKAAHAKVQAQYKKLDDQLNKWGI